jgi:hypothetical protein
MLDKISALLVKYAKGWIVLVFLALDVIFMAYVMPNAGAWMAGDAGAISPLDLQFFYTPARAFEMIASYSDYGRQVYKMIELTLDIIYPIIYTLSYSLLITFLFQRAFDKNGKIQKLHLFPFGAWLFDLLENLGIVTLLYAYPLQPTILAIMTGVFTSLKWLFAFASIIAVMGGLVGWVVKALPRSKG